MIKQSILSIYLSIYYSRIEASRGAGAQSVTVKSTGFDPHTRKGNIFFHLYFHFCVKAKRGVEFRHSTRKCLNTRFPLPTLLCAGNSVKLF